MKGTFRNTLSKLSAEIGFSTNSVFITQNYRKIMVWGISRIKKTAFFLHTVSRPIHYSGSNYSQSNNTLKSVQRCDKLVACSYFQNIKALFIMFFKLKPDSRQEDPRLMLAHKDLHTHTSFSLTHTPLNLDWSVTRIK